MADKEHPEMNEDVLHDSIHTRSNKLGLSSLPIKWKWGILMSCMLALIVISWAMVRDIRIETVEVDGQYFSSLEEIQTIANRHIGVLADSLEAVELIHALEEIVFIKEASVYVESSGCLKILLEERKPLAFVVDGRIQAMIDSDGVILPSTDKMVDLPLLHGLRLNGTGNQNTADSTSNDIIAEFLKQMHQDSFANATISELVFEPANGIVVLSNDNGVKVHFGMNDFEQKIKNWKAFHQQVVKFKGMEAFTEIDLRFTNQIITREV